MTSLDLLVLEICCPIADKKDSAFGYRYAEVDPVKMEQVVEES